MRYNQEIHHRRSIRLKGYDYSSDGMYFVTICNEDGEHLLGKIVNGTMIMNEAGRMVEKWWKKIPEKFPLVGIDTHIVMLNHLHGIIFIVSSVGADPCVRPDFDNGVQIGKGGHIDQEGGHTGPPLPRVMQWFKTMTTNEYLRNVKQQGWPPFPGRLWQRNYYERIIRDERELENIREYIINNPARWEDDRENRRNNGDDNNQP
jgi:putative transposase